MNFLLDTHVLLWWLDGNPALSEKARAVIADGERLVFVSAATIWEIRIREALGKLDIPGNFHQVLAAQPFEMLDITPEHAHAIAGLADHHRDPFDRMLVAQAKTEGLGLVTRDRHLRKYNIPIIEA
ncbi:MAG: type II toxin-antitoxin system VapC family toxin [Pseudomonadales bacterium]|jgi:PIN domain nuclease of toxin-antitoxin system|nr:type II toxin-antitoxin system VapC family toxin [Pseudomonadales bacterium]MDP7597261.1 type II toxin-antitoxin system VapC family toxin [Pseudomonadales bacterium]HJN50267.1 type II toxin-antitoxin system VapC family toxin [Pseudomonadales bacterium]|tara:strand:+ start:182 stop:559 length:378 start_codon:yes stop_codon:yes gene_type:complete